MDGMTKTEEATAWGWLLEALAGFKEVDVSLLHELVDMAPELPEELEKKVNERVALRCLEDLFTVRDVTASISTSTFTHYPKVTFDLSERCDDVLQRIMNETPVSELKSDGPGMLKWDVEPFIRHKRATMPKCALRQLKDSILEGTHPYADFLLRKSALASSSDRDHDCDRDGVNERVFVSDSGRRFGGSCYNAQNTRVEGNDANVAGEDRNRVNDSDDLHRKSGLTSNRDGGNDRVIVSDSRRRFSGSCSNARNTRVEGIDANVIVLDAENVADEDDNRVKDSDGSRGNAKRKLPFSLLGSGRLEDLSQRYVPVFERERCVLSEYPTGVIKDCEVVEDGHDNYATPKRCGESARDAIGKTRVESSCVAEGKDDNGEHCPELTTSGVVPSDETQNQVSAKVSDCSIEHGSHVKVAHAASADRSQHKTTADAAKEPVDFNHELSDSDGINNEKIGVSTKMHDFLTSQCTLNRAYSDTIDWTEQNLCMKCNEGGELLICSTSDCPLVYHEKCLGTEFVCYENGNFYCPFCSHSLALKEYLEAKKKASLLKKDLDAFMSSALEHQPGKLR